MTCKPMAEICQNLKMLTKVKIMRWKADIMTYHLWDEDNYEKSKSWQSYGKSKLWQKVRTLVIIMIFLYIIMIHQSKIFFFFFMWQKCASMLWWFGQPGILYYLYYLYFPHLMYFYFCFDHLCRWWSWRMSSLAAQALCWCVNTCFQICQKSFGIPSVLSPHPRSKVTWWCCWKEWLSATRTPSCTGWASVPHVTTYILHCDLSY